MNWNKTHDSNKHDKEYDIKDIIFLFKMASELSKLKREEKKNKLKELITYITSNYPDILKDKIEKILIIFEIENTKNYFEELDKVENYLEFYSENMQKTYIPELYFVKTENGLSLNYFNEVYEKVEKDILEGKKVDTSNIPEKYRNLLDYLIINEKIIEEEMEKLFNLPVYYMSELYEIIYPSEFLIKSEEEYREYLRLIEEDYNDELENNIDKL